MPPLEQSLDEVVPELLRMTGVPGLSIAVGHRGEPMLARAYGVADRDTGAALAPEAIFPAGSMTKLYTAVAVLQLVDRGELGLHDAVREHGIECVNPLGAREVTIHDLLTFRSGLATDTTGCSLAAPPPPLAEHVARSLASAHGPEYAGASPRWGSRVGERYHYANLGISMLGLLVERRNPDGLSLGDYLDAHVLSPLGMTSSWLSTWDEPPDVRVPGYACFGPRLAVRTPDVRSADHPANGLHTTAADHLRLLLALLDGGGPLLERRTVELMLTPQVAMGGGDGVWPGGDWWTGLVPIISGLGTRLVHFGHPGSHMWGWWSVSRAYPELDCAVVACLNGWDMLRWHNPANRDAAVMAVELVANWFAASDEERARPLRGWAAKRAWVAGALLAERTAGSLGAPGDLRVAGPDGLAEGIAAAGPGPLDRDRAASLLRDGDGAPPPEQLEALLHDLGMVYGCPTPMWFWPERAPSAPMTVRAIAV
jgi:CubicO group peptidase (beta-lactamase class C family)